MVVHLDAPTDAWSHIETLAQTLSIVVGVVISILSFNEARRKEAEARKKEAEARKIEVAKPFLELRQRLYGEALTAAGVLSNPDIHSSEELTAARKRFRELYVSELSMVEDPRVESKMVALARRIDPELLNLTEAQQAAFELAHALSASFTAEYGIDNQNRRT